MPGVTRDRRYGATDWGPTHFRVVDTGGLDPSAAGILGAMRQQSLRALDEADLVVFVVDAQEGITTVDTTSPRCCASRGARCWWPPTRSTAKRRRQRPPRRSSSAFPRCFRSRPATAAASVRCWTPWWRSCPKRHEGRQERRRGRPDSAPDAANAPLRLAFIGKPNVGKSSLVNALLGEERVLVHDQPGTTRDPIDTPLSFGGREYLLVDTAGMRRRRSIDTLTEHVAAKMARDQLERADVAALVIDAREGATAEDARLASLIEDSGRCALVVLNKKDLVSRSEIDAKLESTREALNFLRYAPILLTSAVTRAGVTGLLSEASRVLDQASRRISTGELNQLLEDIIEKKPPPAGRGGRHIRLYYATQPQIRPPTFYVSTNHPAEVGYPYRRFLVNRLRETYGFEGTPIRLVFRAHKQKNRAAPPPVLEKEQI